MGVLGLTSFVDKYFTGWRRKKVEGYLVVDGSSLCHRLYCFDWAHGGQYQEFHAAVLECFQALLRSGIKPIVVLDGIDYKREKTEVTLRRRKEWIHYIHSKLCSMKCKPVEATGNIIPLFAKEVFQQAVLELGVPLYVADGEADAIVVEIANFYRCPVLSSDSDFYMFNVTAGYIPACHFHWKTTPIMAKVYFVQDFLDHFGLRHESVRFIIPAIVGNDFIPSVHSPSFSRYILDAASITGRHHSLLPVVKYACSFQTLEDFVSQIPPMANAVLKENCMQASKMYNVTRTLDPTELMLKTELKLATELCLPDHVLDRYRKGQVPLSLMEAVVLQKCLLRVVVDDSKRQSSFALSKPIRAQTYKIFGLTSVVEMLRHGLDIVGEKALPADLVVPCVTDIPEMSSCNRELTLYRISSCSPHLIQQTPAYWKLLVVATTYWVLAANIPAHLVKALILCFIICTSYSHSALRRVCKESVCSSEFRESSRWLAALHAFTQWQCTYFDVTALNQLLMEPVKSVSPLLAYNGKIIMHLASCRDIDSKVTQFSVDRMLYDQLVAIVLSASRMTPKPMPCKLKPPPPRKESESSTRSAKGKQKSQSRVVSTFAHQNYFALLDQSDSDSDSSGN